MDGTVRRTGQRRGLAPPGPLKTCDLRRPPGRTTILLINGTQTHYSSGKSHCSGPVQA